MKKKLHKPRHLVAINPLMRKGGAHDKTRKAKRHNEKQALKVQIRHGNFEKVIGQLFSQDHRIKVNASVAQLAEQPAFTR